jgi:hypothetical protein
MILFYGNIFWVFPKLVRYKNSLIRVAICAGWFAAIFGANYFTASPLFDRANQVIQAPKDLRRPSDSGIHMMQTGPLPNIGIPIIQNGRLPDSILHVIRDGRLRDSGVKVMLNGRITTVYRDGPASGPNAISFMTSDWWHIQPVILFAFLVILGISIAYFFLKAWAKSELVQTRLQANQLSTEIKFLKSQVNPHFLFNTLNNLFSMAQEKGNDELADGISKLSGMMRYMLYDSNEEKVSLSKEIAYLEECITLNKLRYADEEVVITFDHPGPNVDTRIAPMLFIPFVENAFKHGVAIGQKAAIEIALAVSGEKLIFTCVNIDYGFIRKMEMEISGIGLENVRRRLELVYPGKHRLTINKENDKFMVNLEIDLS